VTDFTTYAPQQFQFADDLSGLSDELLGCLPEQDPYRDIILPLALMAHRSFCSAVSLLRSGYVPESQSHIRTLLEITIHIRYFLVDPEKHAAMWRNHREIERWGQATDRIDALEDYKRSLEAREGSGDEIEQVAQERRDALTKRNRLLRKVYKDAKRLRATWMDDLKSSGQTQVDPNSWSLLSLYQMSCHSEVDMTFQFLFTYRYFSQQVHPSPLSAHKFVGEHSLVAAANEKGLETELVGTCTVLMKIMTTLVDQYSMDATGDKLVRMSKTLISLRED